MNIRLIVLKHDMRLFRNSIGMKLQNIGQYGNHKNFIIMRDRASEKFDLNLALLDQEDEDLIGFIFSWLN